LGERALSPAEHVALDSSSKLVPIRGDSLAAVERGTASFDLNGPGFVNVLADAWVKAFEQFRRNLGSIVFW
jgi:hypothetical protein